MVVCCLPEDLSGADLAVRVVGAVCLAVWVVLAGSRPFGLPGGCLFATGLLSGRLAELKEFCKEVDFNLTGCGLLDAVGVADF